MSDKRNGGAGQTLPAPTLFGVVSQRWWPTTLECCPPGLFLVAGDFGFKTEYSDQNGPEAYCVESGEYFWGGSNGDSHALRMLMVMPVIITPNEKLCRPPGTRMERKERNRMSDKLNAESGGGVGSSVWLECVIRIEHGWLCIRNRAGWLLWSAKAIEVDTHQGVVLADITDELHKLQSEWQRDHDEMEETQHSNDELSDGPPKT